MAQATDSRARVRRAAALPDRRWSLGTASLRESLRYLARTHIQDEMVTRVGLDEKDFDLIKPTWIDASNSPGLRPALDITAHSWMAAYARSSGCDIDEGS